MRTRESDAHAECIAISFPTDHTINVGKHSLEEQPQTVFVTFVVCHRTDLYGDKRVKLFS